MVLETGRHSRGFPELVGSILVEDEPKPSHMDPIRTRFHDFCSNSGILQSDQPVYLLSPRFTISQAEPSRKSSWMSPMRLHPASRPSSQPAVQLPAGELAGKLAGKPVGRLHGKVPRWSPTRPMASAQRFNQDLHQQVNAIFQATR